MMSSLMASRREREATAAGSGEGKKEKENDLTTKHYPWLETFDSEAKAYLTAPSVTISHILKLITLLEGHVSPEVSKLKTRPNRATKLLTQVRKKLSIVKVGGLMLEGESEKELYPTYGLLMTHIVNISLVSSKVERLGAQKVATELYYLLKLMFQGNNEFVLDVVLCSTLDEHASSKNKVGFHLFSQIIEDWRLYSGTHSSQMKFCAIASLLAEGCRDGEQVLDQFLPTDKVDKHFLHFLRQTLDDDFGEPAKKVITSFKKLVQYIKPTTIKSISRSRLVVVSKRDLTGGRREHSGSSDSSSTTVHMTGGSHSSSRPSEVPSSSGYAHGDPMNQILGELGLGDNFFLDTGGDIEDEGSPNHNYYDTTLTDYLHQNDQVSSSTRRKSSSSPADNMDIKNEMEEMDVDEGNSDEDIMLNMYRKPKKGYTLPSPTRSRSDSLTSATSLMVNAPSPRRSQTTVHEEHTLPSPTRSRSSDSVLSPTSLMEREVRKRVNKRMSRALSTSESEEMDVMSDESKDEGKMTSLGISATEKKDEEEDSDLEVVSVIEAENKSEDGASVGSGSSRSRDEEEAESEEDVVPNYDSDSDEELNKASSPGKVAAPEGDGKGSDKEEETQAVDSQETLESEANNNSDKNVKDTNSQGSIKNISADDLLDSLIFNPVNDAAANDDVDDAGENENANDENKNADDAEEKENKNADDAEGKEKENANDATANDTSEDSGENHNNTNDAGGNDSEVASLNNKSELATPRKRAESPKKSVKQKSPRSPSITRCGSPRKRPAPEPRDKLARLSKSANLEETEVKKESVESENQKTPVTRGRKKQVSGTGSKSTNAATPATPVRRSTRLTKK